MQVNCRMGGGPVRDLNLLSWGVDLVEEQLYASSGIPARPLASRTPLASLAEYSFGAPVSGVMQTGDFLAVQLLAFKLSASLSCWQKGIFPDVLEVESLSGREKNGCPTDSDVCLAVRSRGGTIRKCCTRAAACSRGRRSSALRMGCRPGSGK